MAGLIPDIPMTSCVESREAFESFMNQSLKTYFESSVEDILLGAIQACKENFLQQAPVIREYSIRLWNLVTVGIGAKGNRKLGELLLHHLLRPTYDADIGVIIILNIYLHLQEKVAFTRENGKNAIYTRLILGKFMLPMPDASDTEYWEGNYVHDPAKSKQHKSLYYNAMRSSFIFGCLAVLDPTGAEVFSSDLINRTNNPAITTLKSKTAFTIICNILAGFRQGSERIKFIRPNEQQDLKNTRIYLNKIYRLAKTFLIQLFEKTQNYEQELVRRKTKFFKDDYKRCWKMFCEILQISTNASLESEMTEEFFQFWLSKLTGGELEEEDTLVSLPQEENPLVPLPQEENPLVPLPQQENPLVPFLQEEN